ncbi:MAG: DUF2071 domain-containing protein [Acidobacteria bacterium]|nr:DUF2071 domain-containing protein [Acidobacteriota bacterium]
MPGQKFLTAEWKDLLMINYEVDPSILRPFVPHGTELDFWQGKALVSMVGFMFLDTKLRGIPIPFHRHFEEVNLRFYVRRKGPEGWQRGVVFIKEIVPKIAIATVARVCYNENYEAMKMRHEITQTSVSYEWHRDHNWSMLQAQIGGDAQPWQPGSEEEFITEHYWGYARQRDGGTVGYRVEHPPWLVWRATKARFVCDIKNIYGAQFESYLTAVPTSAFVAVGSPVTVYQGTKL